MSLQLIDQIDWQKVDGHIPAIIQSSDDYSVLMLGYMNKEALKQTIETGKVTFFSRTKQRLWVKGETSGNFLHVKDLFLDCDKDTLLIHVDGCEQTCHEGSFSCFSKDNHSLSFTTYLEKVIEEKIRKNEQNSYTSKLMKEGKHRVAQKVGEEAVEVVIASMQEDKQNMLEESADLIFHLLLNLHYHGIKYQDVMSVLKKRRSAKSHGKN